MLDPYRCWVEISRERLRENYRIIQQAVGSSVLLCPVVKADAYRHGAGVVAQLLEEEGARWFAVSSAEEGLALRQAGIQARILVMADFLPASREETIRQHLTPVIHSLDDLAALEAFGEPVAFHLKYDSGMGRLGTNASAAEIVRAVSALRHARLEGLMTHFASASDYDTHQTEEQILRFERLVHDLAAAGIHPDILHLSSTIPVAYGRKQAWRTMVRPGHALYGYVSPARGPVVPERQLPVQPVLQWFASVLTVKEVASGAAIGYGAMYRAPRPMRIAVVSAGYADGVPHRLSNRGQVLIHGKRCNILGAVSMDVMTVDVTEAGPVRAGDRVSLLDHTLDAQEIAKTAGTISYAVLCGISARVRRVYVD